MSNTFEFGEFSASKVKKEINKKKKEILRSIPQLLSIIICVIVVLMTFADFKFAKVMTSGFAANSALFIVLSYGIYYAQKTIGKTTGSKDKEYIESKERHENAVKMCIKTMNDDYTLSDYCAEWSAWEFEKAQKNILSGTGVTEDEWRKYSTLGKLAVMVTKKTKKLKKDLKKEKISEAEYDLLRELKKMPGEKKLAIVRANLMTKQKLSSADLLYESSSRDAREKTPTRMKSTERKIDIMSLGPLTLMMAGMPLIVPEIASAEFTIKTIIYGLTRVFSLLMTAFRGNMNGETLYTVEYVENFKIQCQHLNLALEWRKKHERTENGRDSLDALDRR